MRGPRPLNVNTIVVKYMKMAKTQIHKYRPEIRHRVWQHKYKNTNASLVTASTKSSDVFTKCLEVRYLEV